MGMIVAMVGFLSAVAGALTGIDPSPTTSVVIDLLQIEWWQGIVGLAVVLGLSPAPWILGLAMGRLQFTKTADAAHDRELANRQKAWDAEKAALNEYHDDLMRGRDQRYADLELANQLNIDATEQQKLRADRVTEALAQSTEAIQGTSHVLAEFMRAAKEVSPNGS